MELPCLSNSRGLRKCADPCSGWRPSVAKYSRSIPATRNSSRTGCASAASLTIAGRNPRRSGGAVLLDVAPNVASSDARMLSCQVSFFTYTGAVCSGWGFCCAAR